MNLTIFNNPKFTIKALLFVSFFPPNTTKSSITSTLRQHHLNNNNKNKSFMLFCLLHPMDHNTGPLARKSTTLCALLLISIAALLVLAVPGQAEVVEVGVAKHPKDESGVKLKPVSKPAGKDLKYAEYKKRFEKVCKFSITNEHM